MIEVVLIFTLAGIALLVILVSASWLTQKDDYPIVGSMADYYDEEK